jgi:hypothetical protein
MLRYLLRSAEIRPSTVCDGLDPIGAGFWKDHVHKADIVGESAGANSTAVCCDVTTRFERSGDRIRTSVDGFRRLASD